jgi:hypothetical protein
MSATSVSFCSLLDNRGCHFRPSGNATLSQQSKQHRKLLPHWKGPNQNTPVSKWWDKFPFIPHGGTRVALLRHYGASATNFKTARAAEAIEIDIQYRNIHIVKVVADRLRRAWLGNGNDTLDQMIRHLLRAVGLNALVAPGYIKAGVALLLQLFSYLSPRISSIAVPNGGRQFPATILSFG